MNQNRSVGALLVIIGTLLIVTALRAEPRRTLELVIGVGLILAALVQAFRGR